MMFRSALLLLCLSSICWADLPIDCRYNDVIGTWMVTETDREFDSSIDCSEMGEVVYYKNFTLSYPDIVSDELGFTGTWTMMYNQGFEVNINERSYWASFSYSLQGYDCTKLHIGWARDDTVRHWSCFTGVNADAAQGQNTLRQYVTKDSPALDEMFVNDKIFIKRINKAQSSWTAKAYPEHERYTYREMLQRNGGSYVPLPSPAPATEEQKAKAYLLPTNFDWRDVDGVNYVSPVRDQGGCGSCFTFSSTGLLEARVRIETNNSRQDIFSNQDIVSCTDLSEGCAGGFSYLIGGRYAKDVGFVNEECNPYEGTDEACDTDMTCARTYVKEYEYVGGYYGACNEEAMMEALVTGGPLGVDFNVEDDFGSYTDGIYHHTAAARTVFDPLYVTNHAVLLVGYGVDAATGEKYWTVKNSWGDYWGMDGYFMIRRGTNEVGIESAAFDATVIS